MVAIGKVDTLIHLAKSDTSQSGKQLLSLLLSVDETFNPLNKENDKFQKLQTKLRKNAFALVKKHKYREAAAVFMLYPTVSMLKSAASVLSQQYNQPLLSHLIMRIVEYRYVMNHNDHLQGNSTHLFLHLSCID